MTEPEKEVRIPDGTARIVEATDLKKGETVVYINEFSGEKIIITGIGNGRATYHWVMPEEKDE